MTATVAEPMIETELWVSFASVLRSYFWAANLDGAGAAASATEHEVTLEVGDARMVIACDAASGAGTWTLDGGAATAGQGGTFRLLDDGRVALDGATMELDHAAIDLASLVTRAGKRA